MRDHDTVYPGYGFGRNKGYGTKEHIEAIRIKGRTHFHRMSFRVKGKL
jgi:ribonuclease HII